MALSLTLDLVNEAELEQSVATSSRLVRRGLIKGMTTATVTSAKFALLKALEDTAGMPALGTTYDAAYPTYVLLHRIIRGVPNTGGSMAWVWLHYETAGAFDPIERFAIRDSGQLIAEPTTVAPGTAKQLLCSITSSSPDYTTTTLAASDRPITANYPRNMRAIQLYGLFADRPPVTLLNAGNTVNHATWQSRPRGYWRVDPPDVSWSNRDGMYRVSVAVMSKGTRPGEDWTTYEIPRNPTTGFYEKVKDTDLQALYNAPYQPDLRSDKNGIFAYGFYAVTNLSALLGDTFGD